MTSVCSTDISGPIQSPYGPLWAHFGSMLGPVGSLGAQFGPILGPFGLIWANVGTILGCVWGPFWVHDGPMMGPCLGPWVSNCFFNRNVVRDRWVEQIWGPIYGPHMCPYMGAYVGPTWAQRRLFGDKSLQYHSKSCVVTVLRSRYPAFGSKYVLSEMK
jgi:hypothetical protein